MKKIYLLIITLLFIVGCSIANNPTTIVEDYLTKHQMLDKSISTNYNLLINDNDINQNIKTRYQNAIKKQYRNLTYEIKDEKIDANKATVTVEIKVKDYKSSFNKYNKQDYSLEDYHELVLKSIESSKEKITYTINFTLTKNESNDWKLDNIDSNTKNKLLGIK